MLAVVPELNYNNRMIEINIPGRTPLQLKHLVCDVNGTLALDGCLLQGVEDALANLRQKLDVHLLTADSYGRQDEIDERLGLQSTRLTPGGEPDQKAAFVRKLGSLQTVAIGQGANDAGMLCEAVIGICIFSAEGTATEALLASDLVVPDIISALNILENPRRIIASLRK